LAEHDRVLGQKLRFAFNTMLIEKRAVAAAQIAQSEGEGSLVETLMTA
jgi:hypothetical protein